MVPTTTADKRKIKTHEYLEIETTRGNGKPIPVFQSKTGTEKYCVFNQALRGEWVPPYPKKQSKPTRIAY